MVVGLAYVAALRPHTGPMTSRRATAGALALATALALGACGGADKEEAAPTGPDRNTFEEITPAGLAAVVDSHFGDRVAAYEVFTDQPDGEAPERSIRVTLEDADERDTFLVTVYPEDGSRGQVAKGSCAQAADQSDPQAEVTCFPAAEGGNVTVTHLPFGLTQGNKDGSYVTASGSGPAEREVAAAYESFTAEVPVSDEELEDLLSDPLLGWETSPEINEDGTSLEVAPAQG